MADITMCTNPFCTLRHTCYRQTAPANEYWQSVCYFRQNEETGECDMYEPDTRNNNNDNGDITNNNSNTRSNNKTKTI